MIAINAYSCKSVSLELVKGGNSSSIDGGVFPPFSLPVKALPCTWCAHKVRRTKLAVAASDLVSIGFRLVSLARTCEGARLAGGVRAAVAAKPKLLDVVCALDGGCNGVEARGKFCAISI